jgi:hypothetical protein
VPNHTDRAWCGDRARNELAEGDVYIPVQLRAATRVSVSSVA